MVYWQTPHQRAEKTVEHKGDGDIEVSPHGTVPKDLRGKTWTSKRPKETCCHSVSSEEHQETLSGEKTSK